MTHSKPEGLNFKKKIKWHNCSFQITQIKNVNILVILSVSKSQEITSVCLTFHALSCTMYSL